MADCPYTEDCESVSTGQHLGMVPEAIVGQYDEPFRHAEAGEPLVPAWFEDMICTVHEVPSFSWRRVSLDELDAVQHAIDTGCHSGCHCRCHEARVAATEVRRGR